MHKICIIFFFGWISRLTKHHRLLVDILWRSRVISLKASLSMSRISERRPWNAVAVDQVHEAEKDICEDDMVVPVAPSRQLSFFFTTFDRFLSTPSFSHRHHVNWGGTVGHIESSLGKRRKKCFQNLHVALVTLLWLLKEWMALCWSAVVGAWSEGSALGLITTPQFPQTDRRRITASALEEPGDFDDS